MANFHYSLFNPNGDGAEWVQTRACAQCGKRTMFRRCMECYMEAMRREAEAAGSFLAPPASTPASTPAQPELRKRTRTLDDLVWLVDIGEVGGALDGDEFTRTLAAWRSAPEVTPARPDYWSGSCLLCVRELQERSGDAETLLPPLAQIQPCVRHRKATIALAQWLRGQATAQLFTETFGFGDEPHERGGAA